MLASMFMSGRRTLLVAAICCGLLLFASSCLATVPEGETVGGAKYRKEVLGFSEQQEEEYSQDFAEKSVQLHLPYNFKLIKPKSKAVKEVMEYFFARHPPYAGRWVACDAGVLREDDKNTFWLNLGPAPRYKCKKDQTRTKRVIIKHLTGEFQMANVLDYPCLSQDQLLKRRDKDGKWLVDPESDGGGSASFREYVQKKADENVDMFDKKHKEKNDEL